MPLDTLEEMTSSGRLFELVVARRPTRRGFRSFRPTRSSWESPAWSESRRLPILTLFVRCETRSPVDPPAEDVPALLESSCSEPPTVRATSSSVSPLLAQNRERMPFSRPDGRCLVIDASERRSSEEREICREPRDPAVILPQKPTEATSTCSATQASVRLESSCDDEKATIRLEDASPSGTQDPWPTLLRFRSVVGRTGHELRSRPDGSHLNPTSSSKRGPKSLCSCCSRGVNLCTQQPPWRSSSFAATILTPEAPDDADAKNAGAVVEESVVHSMSVGPQLMRCVFRSPIWVPTGSALCW